MKLKDLHKLLENQPPIIRAILILSGALILVLVVFAIAFPRLILTVNFNQCHLAVSDNQVNADKTDAEG